MGNTLWSCVVKRVAREWKEELLTETALSEALHTDVARIDLIARAARRAGVEILRIELEKGPVYQAERPALEGEGTLPAYYHYLFMVFATDGTKEEWELRFRRAEA